MENGHINHTGSLHPDSSPFEVLAWIKRNYQPDQVVLTTAFGMEGCALIDMLDRQNLGVTVANIDTGFLFEETRRLRERLVAGYPGLKFESWHPDFSPAEQARDYGDRLWHQDPNLCCHLRKVLPLKQNIERFQVWITGLTRSQSESRKNLNLFQWDWQNNILKVCPLVSWQRSDVWRYVDAHDVPCNDLHRQGFPSIGCTHCTRKVDGFVPLTSYSRQGRWEDSEKTECGLHFHTGVNC